MIVAAPHHPAACHGILTVVLSRDVASFTDGAHEIWIATLTDTVHAVEWVERYDGDLLHETLSDEERAGLESGLARAVLARLAVVRAHLRDEADPVRSDLLRREEVALEEIELPARGVILPPAYTSEPVLVAAMPIGRDVAETAIETVRPMRAAS